MKTRAQDIEAVKALKHAEWVYGQPMAPCPACGSYNMNPQIPIAMEPGKSVTEIQSASPLTPS